VWSKRASRWIITGYKAREHRASGLLTGKSITIKDAKRRSGVCAAEITPGDLLCVTLATEVVERQPDRRAEVSKGIVGHVVGKVSEALYDQRWPSRER
jgi:hypothetical protein